jgi:hypothetical protein
VVAQDAARYAADEALVDRPEMIVMRSIVLMSKV